MTELKVAGYARASVKEQAHGDMTMEFQRQHIIGRCDKEGWRLKAIYKDLGHDGASLDRPGLGRLLEDAMTSYAVYIIVENAILLASALKECPKNG